MTINSGVAKALESTFIDSDPQTVLLEAFADKIPAVRQSTIGAVKAFVSKTNLWGSSPPDFPQRDQGNGKCRVTGQEWGIATLNQLIQSAPIRPASPCWIPSQSSDTKADVKKATCKSPTRVTVCVSKILNALFPPQSRPVEDIPKILLSAMTFSSEVDPSTLSLMVPLLSRRYQTPCRRRYRYRSQVR